MNKEQFRKELEDCWFESAKWSPELPEETYRIAMHGYITSRLAALDDGDGLQCILDAQQCQQECEHKNDRAECPFIKNNTMNWNQQARELLKTIVENASPANEPNEYYLHQIALDKAKALLSVDDGQEGKGLRWVKASERLPEDENYPDNQGKYYVRAVANGFRDHVRLDFLKKHPSWYEWLDESAALPLADGAGEKGDLVEPELFITDESVKAGNEMANKLFAESDKEFTLPTSGEPEAGRVKEAVLSMLNENLEAMEKAKANEWTDVLPSLDRFDCIIETYEDLIAIVTKMNPSLTPQQIWNKAIMVADNVCHNRVNIFAGQTEIVDAIELCRKEIMQYFDDEYHIKKMLGTEP